MVVQDMEPPKESGLHDPRAKCGRAVRAAQEVKKRGGGGEVIVGKKGGMQILNNCGEKGGNANFE